MGILYPTIVQEPIPEGMHPIARSILSRHPKKTVKQLHHFRSRD
jgi:hypothetical protein